MRNITSRVFRVLALGITALAFTALGHSVARAEMVTFTTAGCFGTGCAPVTTTSTSSGGSTAEFNAAAPLGGIPGQSVTVNTSTPSGFTVADLGTITLSGTGTFTSTPFTLRVSQTAPTVGSGDFFGTLSGTILANGDGSDTRIVFTNTMLMIGSVTYQLTNLDSLPGSNVNNILFLDARASGATTRISALISAPAAVPEPATMILLGTGLAGAAGAARRRRRESSEQ